MYRSIDLAMPSTIRRFDISLADVDHQTYEEVTLRVAQHPSETLAYMLTRIIAYCVHFHESVDMSKAGLCNADEPALWKHDLNGNMTHWIDVGLPSTERLHKAAKRAQNVIVYSHKTLPRLLEQLQAKQIYRAQDLRACAIDPKGLQELERKIDRTVKWTVLLTDEILYITQDELTVSFEINHVPII